MSPRQPVTTRRAATITAASFAACAVTAMVLASTHPVMTLAILAGVNAAAAAALPAPGVVQAGRLARRALSAPRAALARRRRLKAAAEHALWADRLRIVAEMQRDMEHSHPDDCFCACGIPRADLARFRDQVELIAWEMRQREQERRRDW